MEIRGSTALVTGANRGVGKAFVEALLANGAAKVYAGTRTLSGGAAAGNAVDPRVIEVQLDVTSAEEIAYVAARCSDVNLLINNAGVLFMSSMLKEGADASMRREMEVNVYGLLAMTRAFAPILAKNGGGAIVNMLSVVSWFTNPANSTYGASKHAALVVSDSTRIELKHQGTQVVGVYAGFIETDMTAGMNVPKTSAKQVAERALEGVVRRENHVLADARAQEVWKTTREHPEQLAMIQQKAWDMRPKT